MEEISTEKVCSEKGRSPGEESHYLQADESSRSQEAFGHHEITVGGEGEGIVLHAHSGTVCMFAGNSPSARLLGRRSHWNRHRYGSNRRVDCSQRQVLGAKPAFSQGIEGASAKVRHSSSDRADLQWFSCLATRNVHCW